MKRLFFATLLSLTINALSVAQKNGGMWIPTELNEQEMKELGLQISVSDIFNPNDISIKDAIVHFDGGCTAEIISPKGLILTNHHCGYDNIQFHSSVENDLLTKGFWAKNHSEELPNPGLSVSIVRQIFKVTDKVLDATNGLSPKAKLQKIDENISSLKKQFDLKKFQSVDVKPMFAGNEYYAFIKDNYNDVRLVGAPPQSIGKYGADTDNWKFPRHTCDFSMFRIYVDKNNEPADYSPQNVPYRPKHYLSISTKELKEGDFTFIFGYPGRTSEYLPSVAIEQVIKQINPNRIAIRDIALKTLDKKMRIDDATRIKYAAKYAYIANAWKKWQGESKGLKRSNAIAKRRGYEQKLSSRNPKISPILNEFERLYKNQSLYTVNNALWWEMPRNSEIMYLASLYNTVISLYEKGKLTDNKSKAIQSRLERIYKDFDKGLDAKVLSQIMAFYIEQSPKNLLPNDYSVFSNKDKNLSLFDIWNKKSIITDRNNDVEKLFADTDKLVKKVKKDKFVILYQKFYDAYSTKCSSKYWAIQDSIDELQKEYMALQIATDKERAFFPDANSTLRVSYGKIKGSNPADGIAYKFQTTLDGVIEKYIPNDYEFDLPAKLLDLYNEKDFAPYTNVEGKVPVAFTATNHTTGGNSGSPALDANGNLIGLNFDRQWEGTMSDIYFDPELCRNIMVDTRYILFIIDKFAEAKWLLKEMNIVK